MRISFVIPALNEREGIAVTLRSLPVADLKTRRHEVEVLVIDGESRDGTAQIARDLGATVIVEPRRGYGRAYKTGFSTARGDVIITGDADGSYPFSGVLSYFDEFERQGLDFLTLNRFARMQAGSMSAKHHLGNWVLNLAARILFGVRLRDTQSGMWILRRRAVASLPIEQFSDGMPFSEELKIRALRNKSLRAAEAPGGYAPRAGEAKLSSWRDGFRNLWHLVRMRFTRSPRGNGSP